MKMIQKDSRTYFSLTKQDWQKIGSDNNWITKKAMPVPIRDEDRRNMARDGIYAALNITDSPKPMPHARKKEIETILQDHGIVELFNEISPVTVLQLPKIYKPNSKNIVEVGGRSYYLVHQIPSKDPKKSDPKRGLQKGEHYDGKLILMDIETGFPVELSYDEYASQMQPDQHIRQETLDKLNNEITEWNARLEKINNAVGVHRLPLQLAWAESKINERIESLQGQLEAIEAQENNPLSTSEGYAQWIEFLRNGIMNQSFSLRDTFDTLIFLHKTDARGLIDGIDSGEIPVPEQIRSALKAIAHQEILSAAEDASKREEKSQQREERMEAPLGPDKEPDLDRLDLLNLEHIPQSKLKDATEYHTLQTWARSLWMKKRNIERDLRELTEIRNTFGDIRTFIGSLQSGQRADKYLREEGSNIVSGLYRFLELASKFISRYSVNIIENGTINPTLMGREGTIGNALVGVSLFRIYNVIKETLEKASMPVVEQEKTPIESSEPVEASGELSIQKLSNALWQAFEKRMTK